MRELPPLAYSSSRYSLGGCDPCAMALAAKLSDLVLVVLLTVSPLLIDPATLAYSSNVVFAILRSVRAFSSCFSPMT